MGLCNKLRNAFRRRRNQAQSTRYGLIDGAEKSPIPMQDYVGSDYNPGAPGRVFHNPFENERMGGLPPEYEYPPTYEAPNSCCLSPVLKCFMTIFHCSNETSR